MPQTGQAPGPRTRGRRPGACPGWGGRPRGSRRRPSGGRRCRRSGCPCAGPRRGCGASPGPPWSRPPSPGRRCATGVRVPVRPTYATMSSTTVSTCSGGNLKAIAQRGARLTIPRRACWSKRSTLTTTPSVSYGQVVAGLAPALGEGDDALDVEAGLAVRVDREAQGLEAREGRRLAVDGGGVAGRGRRGLVEEALLGRRRVLEQLVEPGGELAAGRDRRVLLAQATRRRCCAGWRRGPGPAPRARR